MTETIAPDGYAMAPPVPWADAKDRVTYIPRSMLLEMCVRLAIKIPGNIIEFGVAQGGSTRVIKRTLKRYGSGFFSKHGRKQIFALDSFEGLREKYEDAPAGEFAGAIPKVSGVNFIKGYFEDTCTEALRRQVGRVAFANLDADLYSSTLFALNWLTPMLGTGSLILFDEFLGGEFSEARAFSEWSARCGLHFVRIGEFDRDPSGYGSVIDRRVLYQVIGEEKLDRLGRGSRPWKLAYYLNRLGFSDMAARVSDRL